MSSDQDLPPDEGPAAEHAEAIDKGGPEESTESRANGESAATAGNTDGAGAIAAEVHAQLAALTAVVRREHERAAHREGVIDRLHDDNQALRRGELQAMMDPVRAALYRLHDLTRRESARWAADPPDPAHAARWLAAVTDEVAEALARTGVERFAVEPGDTFDPARHRPVETEAVMDPALDGAVVRVRSEGFEQGGRVVRKAEVCVGRPPANNSRAQSLNKHAPT